MRTQKQKKLAFPNIPPVFRGKFPRGHVNDVKGWNFSKAELMEAAKAGKMLAMDLDMTGRPSCSLACGHCFNPVLRLMQKRGELLADADVRQVVKDAKALGLRTVKIIGPGEPLEEKTLFPFLELLAGLDITPLIFTKGTTLGDERRTKKLFGMKPVQFAERLKSFDVSILFGANSFNPELQAEIVGRNRYPGLRNRALELLADAGFNEYMPGEATSLAIIPNPVMKVNIDEMFEVYKWARRRNMYMVAAPTMVSGSCREPEAYRAITPSPEELLDLYVRINIWAIRNNIYMLDDLERDGISAYVGAKPCQQVGAGPFIRRDGLVLRCPGDDVSIQGRIGEAGLAEIWKNSENLRSYGGMINVGCPPKEGRTIPENFFRDVLEVVKERIG
ncbi:radical SAM protein [Candidatus Micrarchaeota archaeon]|nr:radical SAM protein [Candidatus Micrarchaeota archaeon]